MIGSRTRLKSAAVMVSLVSLVLFSGTYVNRYSGQFSPMVFDERAAPALGGAGAKVSPLVMGERLYGTVCITCHQAAGDGGSETHPPLAGSEWVKGPPKRLIRIVLYGLKGEIHVQGHVFNGALMPVFGPLPNSGYNWNDQKVAAVLTFIRRKWGDKASPVSEEDVASVRKKDGNRAEMSEHELVQSNE